MRFLPLCLAMALATPIQAEMATIIAPVFAQLATAPLPDGFVQMYENATATGYINESTPQGESLENWTQLITLTGAKGLALGDAPTNALQFAEYLAGSYEQNCPESMASQAFATAPVPGVSDLFAGYLSCGTLAGTALSESMVFLVMVGREDIYTLQWAEHGPASATPIAFAAGLWQDRLAMLHAHAKLCNLIEGEAAPYPSCTQ